MMENDVRGVQMCSHFSRLSDEILLNICCHLSSTDVVNLARTCKRFNFLLYDRQVVKRINLECASSLTFHDLNWFFKPRVRCENVKSLSLASIYWLTSGELLRIVSRLKSLHCLYVHDTQLTINHLSDILDSCKLIRQLSWTVLLPKKGERLKDVRELANRMSLLQSLYLLLKRYDISALNLLLEKCVSLEELRMSNVMNVSEAIGDIQTVPNTLSTISFPNLHSLVVTMSKRYAENWIDFRILFVQALSQVPFWRVLWADPQIIPSDRVERKLLPSKVKDAEALSVCIRDIPENEVKSILRAKSLKRVRVDKNFAALGDSNLILSDSSITHLEWHNFAFPFTLPESLEHFCLRCQTCSKGNLSSFVPLLQLRRLSVACCVFLSDKGHSYINAPNLASGSSSFSRKQSTRKSRVKRELKDCILKDFTEIAPHVRELEIRCEPFCTLKLMPEQLGSLLYVCNWPLLESLFLEAVQLADFSIITEIAKSCPRLRRFGLINVGKFGCWTGNSYLVKAIASLKNLEDFRFGHAHAGNLCTVIEALSKCSTLRRVAIISLGQTSGVPLNSFLNLVKNCEQLIFLLIRLTFITQKMEKNFQQQVKARFSKQRPALWACIEGRKDVRTPYLCPDIHYRQMVEDPACLSIEPPQFSC